MLHLLLLSLLLLLLSAAATSPPRFREAPKFYNSPDCVDPEDPDLDPVHVAMTLDEAYLRGSMAAILSVLQHSSCPENVFFHFVADAHDGASTLRATVISSFPYLNFRIYPFDGSAVAGLISASLRPALDCPLNYARSYLAALLPDSVRRVVYLDSDLVLVADVAGLAATDLGAAVLAAPEYCAADLAAYFTRSFWASPALSAAFSGGGRRACYFNTGVMVIDLGRWRVGAYTAEIEGWMEVQRRVRIYELGSLPPFLLVFAGRIAPVDRRWNQHGLGGDNFRGRCRDLHPGPVSLLHWSGKGKPWARLDAGRACPLDALWAPYDLLRSPRALDS